MTYTRAFMNEWDAWQKHCESIVIKPTTARLFGPSVILLRPSILVWAEIKDPISESSNIYKLAPSYDYEDDEFGLMDIVEVWPAYTFCELEKMIKPEFYIKKSYDPGLTYHVISRLTGNMHNGKTGVEALEKLIIESISNGHNIFI